MTNAQLIEKFNPINGANLSAEDIEILRSLTDAQIDILADAYPNQPSRKSYLRLYDKNVAANKQVYNLSTFQNLRNLRKYSNWKHLMPWDFFTSATKFQQPLRPGQNLKTGTVSSPKKVVVDLSAKDAAAELTAALTGSKEAKPIDNKKAAPGKQSPSKNKTEAPVISLDKADASGIPADQEFGNGDGE